MKTVLFAFVAFVLWQQVMTVDEINVNQVLSRKSRWIQSKRLQVPNSCEFKEGECINPKTTKCNRDILSEGLCDNKMGKTCCRNCQFVINCRVEASGYFRTFYGKVFNYQEPGTYILSQGTRGGNWSVTIKLENVDGQRGAVLTQTTVQVGGDRIDITQAAEEPISVNGGADVMTSNPFTVRDVTISVNQGPGFPITVIEFYDMLVVDIISGRSVIVTPDASNKGQISGICGDISTTVDTDFTSDGHQLALLDNINKQFDGCPFHGTTCGIDYCKCQMKEFKEACRNDINYQFYLMSCAFSHCIGGETRAQDVIKDYREACGAPEMRGTCVLSGHTFYESFDKKRYHFQGECKELLMAADCFENKWEVRVSHRAVGIYTEVEKVTIRRGTDVVDFIVDGMQVKVGGSHVSIPYNFGGMSIFVQDNDIYTVAFLPEALVVKFNFRQLLVVHIRDPFQGRTCGICGNYNYDPSDDVFDAETSCALSPNPMGCTQQQMPEARRLCENLFTTELDQKCNVCYKPNRIELCMYEYCLNGLDGFCQHAVEYKKECFIKHGDDLQLPVQCLPARTFF